MSCSIEKFAKEVCAGAAVVAVAATGVALVAGLVASTQAGGSCGSGTGTGTGTDTGTDTGTGTGTDTATAFVPSDYIGKTLQQLQDAARLACLRVRLARVNEFGRIIDAACTPNRRVTCNVTIQAQPLVAWTSSTAWMFAENNPQNCLVTSVTAC